MKIVCISDTHCQFIKGRPLDLPVADVLVHSGDLGLYGTLDELETAARILGASRDLYRKVIATGGNHDHALQQFPILGRELLASYGIDYLEDQELIFEGVKFYGSPWTPTFGAWAFMKERGPEIRKVWDKIPLDTNVLITHGPPHGILDKTLIWGDMAGCEELREVVLNNLPALKLHVFGHIHEGYGMYPPHRRSEGPIFVNASTCNAAYSPVNKPIVVEI